MNPNESTTVLFNFWKDNKTDNHYALNYEQLKEKWIAWKEEMLKPTNRGKDWYNHYYGSQSVRCFITDKEELKGLQSVFDEQQFDEIYNALKPLF